MRTTKKTVIELERGDQIEVAAPNGEVIEIWIKDDGSWMVDINYPVGLLMADADNREAGMTAASIGLSPTGERDVATFPGVAAVWAWQDPTEFSDYLIDEAGVVGSEVADAAQEILSKLMDANAEGVI